MVGIAKVAAVLLHEASTLHFRIRCGRDLFVTRSNVTNRSGIERLRRHLGARYRIHEIESRCPNPMHIDTTLLPLAPGKVLVNPDYIDVDRLPDVFSSWDVLVAPEPDPIKDEKLLELTSMCGKWLSMNVLTSRDSAAGFLRPKMGAASSQRGRVRHGRSRIPLHGRKTGNRWPAFMPQKMMLTSSPKELR